MEITGYTDKNGVDIPIDAVIQHEDGMCYVFKKDSDELALYNCRGEWVDHKTIDFNKAELQ